MSQSHYQQASLHCWPSKFFWRVFVNVSLVLEAHHSPVCWNGDIGYGDTYSAMVVLHARQRFGTWIPDALLCLERYLIRVRLNHPSKIHSPLDYLRSEPGVEWIVTLQTTELNFPQIPSRSPACQHPPGNSSLLPSQHPYFHSWVTMWDFRFGSFTLEVHRPTNSRTDYYTNSSRKDKLKVISWWSSWSYHVFSPCVFFPSKPLHGW
jgi:hypothetical protein